MNFANSAWYFAAGIKPGAHAVVAQNVLTLDDLLES